MRNPAIVFLVGALIAVGCSDGGSAVKGTPMSAAAFKGAKVRVFNTSTENFEVFLNGQTYGRPIESQTASVFKLAPGKGSVKVVVKASTGDEEFEIPVVKGTAYTLVYFGKGKTTVIEGEPTEVAGEKSLVYFQSIDGEETGAINIKSGAVTNVDLKNKESREVATGSYVATYKLASGKEATVNFDLAGGHVVSLYLVDDGAQRRLVAVTNHSQMIILGPGGASPTG